MVIISYLNNIIIYATTISKNCVRFIQNCDHVIILSCHFFWRSDWHHQEKWPLDTKRPILQGCIDKILFLLMIVVYGSYLSWLIKNKIFLRNASYILYNPYKRASNLELPIFGSLKHQITMLPLLNLHGLYFFWYGADILSLLYLMLIMAWWRNPSILFKFSMEVTSALIIESYKIISLSNIDTVYFVGSKDWISDTSSKDKCRIIVLYVIQCTYRLVNLILIYKVM